MIDEKSYLEIRDKSVVKSNELIQKSRYKLSLPQQKIILYLCSLIQPHDESFKLHTFEIRELCKICGIETGGKQYELLKATLKDLGDKSLYIMEDRNTEVLARWLDDVKFINKTSVAISLDKAMKPYLLHLHENFTKYELIYTLRMKRSATPRLYELLKSYHYNDLKPYTVTFDLEELRMRLDAVQKTYQEYKYFNRYIIEPSVDEINKQTDIKISVTPLKKKRIVYALKSFIERQKPVDILANIAETDKFFLKALSRKQDADTSADGKNATQNQQEQSVKASTQSEQKPVESSDSQPRKDAQKPFQEPVQEPKTAPAEQPPEREQAQEPKPEKKRLQVRVYHKGKKEKKPFKTFSKYSIEEILEVANQWFAENGYPQIDHFVGETSMRWEV